MNKRKNIFVIVMIVICLFVGNINYTYAIPTKNKNNSYKELEKEIEKAKKDNKITNAEKEKMKSNFSNEALAKNQAEEIEAAMKVVEKTDFDDMNVVYDDENVTMMEKDITLENGNHVKLEICDYPEASILEKGDYWYWQAMKKKYGNRRFDAVLYIEHTLWPDSTLKIYFHYKVGDYGLKARYAESASTSYGPISIEEGNPKITDAKAEKEGWDMNAICKYKVKISAAGVDIAQTTYNLEAIVYLQTLNKKEKYAHVCQYLNYKRG